MKLLWKIVVLLWLIGWTIAGIGIALDAPRQIEKDRDFIRNQIEPSVRFIERFRDRNHRLPTKREFYTWEREYYDDFTVDFDQTPDSALVGSVAYIRNCGELPKEYISECSHIDWKTDYLIAVWRGEWSEYYVSWKKLYVGNDYSLEDGVIGLVVTLCIGLAPIFIKMLLGNRQRRDGVESF